MSPPRSRREAPGRGPLGTRARSPRWRHGLRIPRRAPRRRAGPSRPGPREQEKRRRSEEGGDGAHRALRGREERPRDHVRHDQKDRAPEEGQEKQGAVRARDAAHGVRHEKAHESDDAGVRDGRGGEERRRDVGRSLRRLHADSERPGRLLTECERVEGASERQEEGQREGHVDGQRHDRTRRRARQRAKHPEHERLRARGVAKGEKEQQDRRGERVHDDTREEESTAVQPATRRRPDADDEDGRQRAEKRRERQRERVEDSRPHSGGRAETEERPDERSARGASGDAEEIGIGERVSEQSLKRGAREGQRAAHEHGQQRARKSQLAHDRDRLSVPPAREGAEHVGRRQGHAPEKQRGEKRGEKSAEEHYAPRPRRATGIHGTRTAARRSKASTSRGPGRSSRSPGRTTTRPSLTAGTRRQRASANARAKAPAFSGVSGRTTTPGFKDARVSNETRGQSPADLGTTFEKPARERTSPTNVPSPATTGGSGQMRATARRCGRARPRTSAAAMRLVRAATRSAARSSSPSACPTRMTSSRTPSSVVPAVTTTGSPKASSFSKAARSVPSFETTTRSGARDTTRSRSGTKPPTRVFPAASGRSTAKSGTTTPRDPAPSANRISAADGASATMRRGGAGRRVGTGEARRARPRERSPRRPLRVPRLPRGRSEFPAQATPPRTSGAPPSARSADPRDVP